MTDDRRVDDFMRAVYEVGRHYGGMAHVEHIAPRLGLETSSVVDVRNPTTEDDRQYTSLAQHCEEELRYIEKKADRYVWVKITEQGKRYVGGDPMA
jgi:hypothetical protein